MQPDLVEIISRSLATTLVFGAFLLLINGQALNLGSSMRARLEPVLTSLRSRTSLSRAELADVTVIGAAVVALAGLPLERSAGNLLIPILLLGSRRLIRRATREENRLLAVMGSLSTDLIIGFYVPVILAQVLLLNLATALSLTMVIVALSWPAGGTGIPGRRWRLAPVPTR